MMFFLLHLDIFQLGKVYMNLMNCNLNYVQHYKILLHSFLLHFLLLFSYIVHQLQLNNNLFGLDIQQQKYIHLDNLYMNFVLLYLDIFLHHSLYMNLLNYSKIYALLSIFLLHGLFV